MSHLLMISILILMMKMTTMTKKMMTTMMTTTVTMIQTTNRLPSPVASMIRCSATMFLKRNHLQLDSMVHLNHCHQHHHRLNLTMVGSDLNSFLTVFKATDRPILSVTWMIKDQTNYDDDIDDQQLMLIMMISIWLFPLFRCLWW